ncbi:ABC transporter ATP-binding protein [Agrococcus beijingensis]|uniref:ABC transporter ATP-binding protein n=1 Tax=Agrococcus beijingensis TaxID=3068634 RepID=UPI002741B3B5|nr:ABC transporter ATP-binding protein [Agrococcus sp. REN33]
MNAEAVRSEAVRAAAATAAAATTLLAARDVSFGYAKGAPVIAGFDDDFVAGEVVALTGPSGRGKSTLLYVLGLMLAPTAGAVEVDGRDASQLRDGRRARLRADAFGFVFQDAALDATRTVLDNVLETTLYRGQSRAALTDRAYALLDRFGVSVRADHKPGQISGGQAQRIAVCRALLGDPRIVLADEPTGNLDAASSATVVGALREQASRGAAVVIATHDRDVMAQCDRRVAL